MSFIIECFLPERKDPIPVCISLYRTDVASVFYEKFKEKGLNVEYVNEDLLRLHGLKNIDQVHELGMLEFPNWTYQSEMKWFDIKVLDKFISML